MRALNLHFDRLGKIGSALLLLTLAVACLTSAPAHAYDDRIALVIGNDNYTSEPLKNAVNDARAMQTALQALGFKVVFKSNADYQTMQAAAVEFAKQMDGATAAVFYYAGHGIQYSNRNFLIPVNAKLAAEQEIPYFAVDVNQILGSMEDANVKHKFIILDACRNNPFRNLNVSAGLAKSTRVPQGTIISYAAAAGAVALDGEGENGLYTKNLVREIRNPGLTAGGVFDKVGSAVALESNGRQNPELQSTSSARGAFFFAERGAVVTSASNASVSGETAALLERDYWTDIKDSKKIEDFQDYLQKFPSGFFVSRARSRIDNLKQEKSQQQVAAVPLSATPTSTAPVLVAERTETARPSAASVAGAPSTVKAMPSPTEPPPVRVARDTSLLAPRDGGALDRRGPDEPLAGGRDLGHRRVGCPRCRPGECGGCRAGPSGVRP